MSLQDPEDDLAPIPLVGDEEEGAPLQTAASASRRPETDLEPIPLAGEEEDDLFPQPEEPKRSASDEDLPAASADEDRGRASGGARKEPWTAPEVARDPQLRPLELATGTGGRPDASAAEAKSRQADRPSAGRRPGQPPAALEEPEPDDGPLELVELLDEPGAPPVAESAPRSLLDSAAAAGPGDSGAGKARAGKGAGSNPLLLVAVGGGGLLILVLIVAILWMGDGSSQPVVPVQSGASPATAQTPADEADAEQTLPADRGAPIATPSPVASTDLPAASASHVAVVISENSHLFFQRLAHQETLPEDVPAAPHMRQIALALQAFLQRNNGRWPERLQDLQETMPNFSAVMRNPRTGEPEGFVFEPPLDHSDPAATPILWEARRGFRDPQGAVLYADGRIARP